MFFRATKVSSNSSPCVCGPEDANPRASHSPRFLTRVLSSEYLPLHPQSALLLASHLADVLEWKWDVWWEQHLASFLVDVHTRKARLKFDWMHPMHINNDAGWECFFACSKAFANETTETEKGM